jgi:hypothetical protein
VPLVVKHAYHLTQLARAATEPNIQHAYYLEVGARLVIISLLPRGGCTPCNN